MTNRINKGFIFLFVLFLLAACSSKPVRHEASEDAWIPQQSSNQHKPFPIYRDEDVEPRRHGGYSSNVFPRPADIEPQVAFWRKAYSRWGRSQVAIHDKVHMDIIYDVFDLPGDASDILTAGQKTYIQDRFYDWKSRLSALEDKVATGRALDGDEKELVRHIAQKTGLRNAIQGASDRLRYQRGLKERFKKGLEIGRHYDGQFRQIFRNAGLPEDLAYLPHVESSFQYNAHSSAGALGIWQFTSGAAKMFMNSASAEARLDPITSTRGAARYLAYAYEKLGSWPLAVTSYNHGIGGMQRARNIYGHDFMRIVKHYDHPQFGFASRNYYAEFLAARDIASDPERYFAEGAGNENYMAWTDNVVSGDTSITARIPEPQEVEQPLEAANRRLLESSVAETGEPEPVSDRPIAIEPESTPAEPIYQAEPVQAEPTQAEPIYLAEFVEAEPTKSLPIYQAETEQAEPIYQAEPVQAEPTQAEPLADETAESAETEATEVDEAESRMPSRTKSAKATITSAKKTEMVSLTTEPKKLALVTAQVDSKKSAKGLVPSNPIKTAKAVSLSETKQMAKLPAPTDPKKAAMAIVRIDSKTAAKLPATANPKQFVKAAPPTTTPIQPTPASHGQGIRKKPTPIREAEKKSLEKIRIAKR